MEQPKTLADLRRSLVNTRVELANKGDELPRARARAERRAIDAAGGDEKAMGSNEAARSRALTIALADDDEYRTALANVRSLEAGVLRLEAEIEIARDERRERERLTRERLISAMDASGHYVDEVTNGDALTDEIVTTAVEETALRIEQLGEPPDEADPFAFFEMPPEPTDSADTLADPFALPEPPPLPEDDRLLKSLESARPGAQLPPLDAPSGELMSAMADYQSAIGAANTETDVAKIVLDLSMDTRLDNATVKSLTEFANKRKAVLAKTARKGR